MSMTMMCDVAALGVPPILLLFNEAYFILSFNVFPRSPVSGSPDLRSSGSLDLRMSGSGMDPTSRVSCIHIVTAVVKLRAYQAHQCRTRPRSACSVQGDVSDRAVHGGCCIKVPALQRTDIDGYPVESCIRRKICRRCGCVRASKTTAVLRRGRRLVVLARESYCIAHF